MWAGQTGVPAISPASIANLLYDGRFTYQARLAHDEQTHSRSREKETTRSG